ncbi:hypothetical protein HHK36_027953 [Tetracentron sinense]|uniref:Pectinesterase inhibitor domain-containing protein n=1 Tax=Tetracentron sinense TaxID=13715 RepID=A0A835D1I6_TETSI|nr:hypothetical protein HHK36_027953 [Tetracentron sinense]
MEGSIFSRHVLIALLILLAFASTMNSCLAARAISCQTSVEFVRNSCNSTTYPQLCYSSLSSYASAIQSSPKLLTQTAISVSLATARSASTTMSELSKSRGMKPREVRAMIDCVEEMSECVEQLKKSVEKMSHVGGFKFVVQMSDIQTWVSAALTDEDTCMEGFTGNAMNGTVKSKVRCQVVNLAHLTSNALSLINTYAHKPPPP